MSLCYSVSESGEAFVVTTVSIQRTQHTARNCVKATRGVASILRVVAVTLISLPAIAPADETSTQRPLPLPDQQSVTENDHLQRLRQLRAMMQQAMSSNDKQSGQQTEDLPGNSANADKQAPDGRELQQLGDALKSLADKLPPGMIPPSLDSIPKEQLREAVRNPAVQERMRKMLEQFRRDGLLPKENTDGSQTNLPLPPMQERPFETDGRENRGNRDENGERSNSPAQKSNAPAPSPPQSQSQSQNRTRTGSGLSSEQSATDSNPGIRPPSVPGNSADQSASEPNAIPPQSMRMLEQFLKGLTNQPDSDDPLNPNGQTNPNDQAHAGEAQSFGTDQQRPPRGDSAQTQTNPGSRPRGPLRRKDRSTNSGEPIQRPGFLPPTGPIARDTTQPGEHGERMPPSTQGPETQGAPKSDTAASSQQNTSASGSIPDADRLAQMLKGSSAGDQSESGSNQPGLSMTPEQLQRSLQAVQEVLPAVLQELAAEQNSSSGASGGLANSLKSMAEGIAQNNSGLSSGQSNSPSPQNMQAFTEMLDQLKSSDALKSLGQSAGQQDASRPNGSSRVERRESVQRQPILSGDSGAGKETSRSSPETPINIARELEQRGFGETLKKLVEKAKEETREAARRPSNGSAAGTASENLSLNESALKMLEGMRDEMSELAKDPEIQREILSGAIQPQTRPQAPLLRVPGSSSSPSAMQRLRSTFREMLGESANSPNAGQSRASTSPSNASVGTAGAVEFDFRAVGFMAAIIAILLVGAIGLKFWGQRIVQKQESPDTGPPILPSQVASKADVIRAFHQLVLKSTRPIQVWWTHRAAQKVLEAAGPEHRAAVETLTETYEKARYLPQEAELTPEQIQSARAALQAVSRA
jgi:hypothetical protein